MYDRALHQFSNDNSRKLLKDVDVKSKNNLNFFHFHIEAFDDQIAINTFSPETRHYNMNPRMLRASTEARTNKDENKRPAVNIAKKTFTTLFNEKVR